jgi:hypothetical protein
VGHPNRNYAVLLFRFLRSDPAFEAPYKFQKARREEAEAERVKSSVICAPTPNELKIYGQSPTERILHERFKNAGPDALNPRPFVVDSSERKL